MEAKLVMQGMDRSCLGALFIGEQLRATTGVVGRPAARRLHRPARTTTCSTRAPRLGLRGARIRPTLSFSNSPAARPRTHLVALHRRARSIAAARRRLSAGGASGADDEPEIVPDRLDEATLVEALDDLGAGAGVLGGGLRAAAPRTATNWPPALPARPAAARPDRRRRAHDRARRRGGRAGGAGAGRRRPGARPPRRARRHRGPVRRRDRRRRRSSAFLAFLAAAEDEERGLAPGEVEVVEGAVQILTAHAAKGLEWDVVAVAGLTTACGPGRCDGVRPLAQRPRRAAVPAARRPRPGCPGSTCRGAGDQKGVASGVGRVRRAWRDARRTRGAAAGVRRGHPAPPAAAVLRVLVGRGRQASARPVGVPGARSASVCLAGAGVVDGGRRAAGARPEPDAPRRCRAPSGPATRWARAGRRWPRRPGSSAADAAPSRPAELPSAELPIRRADRGRALAAARPSCCSPSASAAAPTGAGRGGAARAPVGVAAGHAARATRSGWRGRCAGRCRAAPTRTPAGARRSTLAGAAVRRRPAARPRRAARRRRRGRRARRRARRAAGAVPGERVGRPRRRSTSRCRSPPWSPASWSAAGWTRCSPTRAAGSTSSTGRPAAARRASTRARPRCSSPRTGWPGRSWRACRWSGSRAAFHYVRDGETVRPADLLDAGGLAALITGVPLRLADRRPATCQVWRGSVRDGAPHGRLGGTTWVAAVSNSSLSRLG